VIDRIYIATHKHDLRFARICVASIRYWYPDVSIYLIKDAYSGEFSTDELERVWDVSIYQTKRKNFGWGMSKLEPVFSEPGGRFLILDADTVFTGRVLDRLQAFTEDFVVSFETQTPQRIGEIYFDLEKLQKFDPQFVFKGQTFNTGQYVAAGGRLSRADFPMVDWTTSPPSLKQHQIFKNGEQGALNYVLLKKAALGELTLGGTAFMRWPANGIDDIEIHKFGDDSPYADIIHWAGLRDLRLGVMIRSDILQFFEDYYYSRVGFGTGRKRFRVVADSLKSMNARISRRIVTH
jgi:hypothetical protein